MKIATIIGTRPEIIKMTSLLPRLDEEFNHTLIHADQHYSYEMDALIFQQLKLRVPNYRLSTNKMSPAVQVGDTIQQLAKLLSDVQPDLVVLHGDTNSTLAGAIAANKLAMPIAHVEAGVRWGLHKKAIPEDYNRFIVDHLSEILFAPDEPAVNNMLHEHIQNEKIHLVGSTIFDCVARNKQFSNTTVLEKLKLKKNNFLVVTLHRQENVDNLEKLKDLLAAIDTVSEKIRVVFPIHPRTQKAMSANKIEMSNNVVTTEPLGYLEMLALLHECRFVMTDSGGLQEEASAFNKPCLILRDVTEWVRLIDAGKNFIATTHKETIINQATRLLDDAELKRIHDINCSSDDGASEKIINILKNYY